jgi:hypothetical protein
MSCPYSFPVRPNVTHACGKDAVPGLTYCREHALEKLAAVRAAEQRSLQRVKARGSEIIDLDLRRSFLQQEDARDRRAILEQRETIADYELCLDPPTEPPP